LQKARATESPDAWLDRLAAGCDDCEGNEIDSSGSLEQALSLLNGQEINDIVAAAVPHAVAEGVAERAVPGGPRTAAQATA
jgi:hypothetical protein